jgi:glycosyltransferase involved in cell wall biosynthesis
MAEEKPPLKIGYVVKMYPRFSETFIANEILELEKRGADVTIFSIKKPNEGQFHPQVAKIKAKAYYLEDLDSRKWPQWLAEVWKLLGTDSRQFLNLLGEAFSRGDSSRAELLMMATWVAAQAKHMELDHLHAHFASLPSTIAYLASQITGITFSFTAHAKDIFVYTPEEHLLREKLLSASFVITVTQFNHRFLKESIPEIGSNTVKVIHNGVDLEQFAPDLTRSRNSDLILSVGRLVPKKGFADLLDACHLLKNKNIPFRCNIVGDGPEMSSLLQKRRDLNLEGEVVFSGPKRQDEVLELMRQATLLCLPCTIASDGNQDALPTVILEALACGLPVISTKVSGIPEMIDSGVDGILVEPNDPVSLSEQIALLLNSKKLQMEFAQNGRHKAEDKFDLKKNVGALFDLYLSQRANPKRVA